MTTAEPLPTKPRGRARTGGYVLAGEECHPLRHAVCYDDDGYTLSVEAEGDGCLFHLRKVLWEGHIDYTDSPEDLIGWAWPPYPEWVQDDDLFADSGFALPGRCLRVLGAEATITGFDRAKRLVFVELTVTAESDEGDYRGEFEVWLACEYHGELLAESEDE